GQFEPFRRLGDRFSGKYPASLFLLARGQKGRAQLPIVLSAAIPGANDMGRRWIEPSNSTEPGDPGVDREIGRIRMVPGDLRREAPHRQCARERSVDQKRATAFEKLDQPIEAGCGRVGEPALPQFFQTRCEKHGPSPNWAMETTYVLSTRNAWYGTVSDRPGRDGVSFAGRYCCRP